MGLFKKKNSRAFDVSMHKIKLTDSLEEEQKREKISANKNGTAVFRRYMPTFRRLVEYDEEDSQDSYSLGDDYEPPSDLLTNIQQQQERPKKKQTKQKQPTVVNSFGSDHTFDIRDDETVTLHTQQDEDASTKLNGEHSEFSQVIFRETFNTLETVLVNKSDSGASDSVGNAQNISTLLAAAGDLHKAQPADENSGDIHNKKLWHKKNPFRSEKKPKATRSKTAAVPPKSDGKLYHQSAFGSSNSQNQSQADKFGKPFRTVVQQTQSKALFAPQADTPAYNEDDRGHDNFVSVASRSLAPSQKSGKRGGTRRPPKTITTSDQSVTSNVSTSNATFVSDVQEFSKNHPFFDEDEDASSKNLDPFGETTYWNAFMDPFSQRIKDLEPKIEKTSSSDTSSLIDSIKRNASKSALDPEENSYKPDPSPRGVKHSSSDSHVSYWESGAVRYTGPVPPPPPPPPPVPQSFEKTKSSREKKPSVSDISVTDIHESNSDTQISYWENGSVAYSVGPQRNPPVGLPNNAVLGSMLFRHTHPGKATTTTAPVLQAAEEDDADDAALAGFPPSILTAESTESAVSSVTEEASSFYQKNFQGWKAQAHNVLNNYHKANKTTKTHPVHHLVDSQMFLDPVEEENANMFNAY